jgi:hypothetical protein
MLKESVSLIEFMSCVLPILPPDFSNILKVHLRSAVGKILLLKKLCTPLLKQMQQFKQVQQCDKNFSFRVSQGNQGLLVMQDCRDYL